ncbi:MAG: winged helix-turn-helix transcriptional regulator [Thermoplasmatota archaeon]
MHVTVRAVLLLLLVAPLAAGQPAGDDLGVRNATDDADNLLETIGQGLGDAAQGVGDAAQGAGKGVGKGLTALGEAFGAAVGALADGTAAVVRGLSQVSILAALGVAEAAGMAVRGLYVTFGAVGNVAGLAATGLGKGIGAATVAVGSGIGLLASAYAGLVGSLRPEAMPAPAFAAVVATGSTASAGAGGWAGWQALRRWGGVLGPLGGIGGMAGFSRLQDDQLLEHPVRGQIFQAIQQNPGIHASHLARTVDAGWGTVTHHLSKLEKARLVTTRSVNNHKCYFENGGTVGRQDMEVASALKNDTAASIAAFVLEHPMSSQKAVAEALGISAALTSFHVKKLVGFGVLDRMRHGKESLLTTSESMRRVLAAQTGPYGAAAAQSDLEGFSYVS